MNRVFLCCIHWQGDLFVNFVVGLLTDIFICDRIVINTSIPQTQVLRIDIPQNIANNSCFHLHID